MPASLPLAFLLFYRDPITQPLSCWVFQWAFIFRFWLAWMDRCYCSPSPCPAALAALQSRLPLPLPIGILDVMFPAISCLDPSWCLLTRWMRHVDAFLHVDRLALSTFLPCETFSVPYCYL